MNLWLSWDLWSHWALQAASVLLSYMLYSLAACGLVFAVARCRFAATPLMRCWLWRWALALPVLVTLLGLLMPAPAWLPAIGFSLHASSSPAAFDAPATGGSLQSQLDGPRVASDRQSWIGGRQPLAESSIARRSRSDTVAPALTSTQRLALLATVAWAIIAVLGMVRLSWELRRMTRLKQRSRRWCGGPLVSRLQQLQRQSGHRGKIDLYSSAELVSPITGGIRTPYIIVPDIFVERFATTTQDAVLAHELAHVARRDAAWNLFSLVICRLAFLQPLNHWARRQLRIEAEYVADSWAAELLNNRLQLARCLAELGDWLLRQPRRSSRPPALAIQMSGFRSGLGRRVAALLDPATDQLESTVAQRTTRLSMLWLCPCLMLLSLPRTAVSVSPSPSESRNLLMKSKLSTVAVLFSLAVASPVAAQNESKPAATADGGETAANETDRQSDPVGVPEQLQQFSGMLIGKMVSRDVERGEFTVEVQHVARVWENNKAPQPRAAVGKTLVIDGVSGKWIDNLLLIRPGDTMEFEAQHRGGDRLTFPGEGLRKVATFNPADHPTPPEGLRGLAGMVIGKIAAKHNESGELILQIQQIENTFEKNKAKNPQTGVGQSIVLAGFWGPMRKPFDQLTVGDTVRAGVLHRVPQSDHFTVVEMIEKTTAGESTSSQNREAAERKERGGDQAARSRPAMRERELDERREAAEDRERSRLAGAADEHDFPAGMKGFRGILKGTVVSRDVERGQLVIRAEGATRVWKQNKAEDVGASKGNVFRIEGISGKWIDVLLTLKPGDLVEVEAFHNQGAQLDFVAEWLRKVE